jgi:hypothetical protein
MPPLQQAYNNGSLAQLVEQLTFNQLVAGSNPARPTTCYRCSACLKSLKIIKHLFHAFHVRKFYYGSLAQLVEQLTFNQLVAGSNPARPTIIKHKHSNSMGR